MKKFGTLKYKFTIVTLFMYAAIIISVLFISYFCYLNFTLSSRKELGYEILNLVNNEINADHIDYYLSGRHMNEYYKSLKRIQHITNTFQDVHFLSAYKIPEHDSTATVLFDTDKYHLGDICKPTSSFRKGVKTLHEGSQLAVLTDHTKRGCIMTVMQPIKDSENHMKGILSINFDLSALRQSDINFMLLLFVFLLTVVILITIGTIHIMDRRVLGPIEEMYLCLKDFKYTSNHDRVLNLCRLQSLDINASKEVQSLYVELLRATSESYTYMEEYKLATERLGVTNEMAYYDSLTGLYNKNSYNAKIKEFQNRIENKSAFGLAVIMVDINNLKYVNDTFGHRFGDDYIKGCCSIIDECVAGAPIYRIGGDEFVVLLEDKPFEMRETIYEDLQAEFAYAFTKNAQPYEKYSASVGMSIALPTDTAIKDVITRADMEMYKAKAKFRENYGSYR